MTKYKLKVQNDTWHFFKEGTGWVTVKYMTDEGLSRTQIRAIDIESALQYIWSTYNGIEPLRLEDVEEIQEGQFL